MTMALLVLLLLLVLGLINNTEKVSLFASAGNLSVSFKVPILIANSIANWCLHFNPLVELSLQLHQAESDRLYFTK